MITSLICLFIILYFKMVKYLLTFWANWSKAKSIPSITNFLVTNPMFKRMALSYHKAKGQTTEDIDKWLEKELLTKEQYDKIYSDKRIDSREQNMTTSNKINENEYKNKL